MSILQQVSNHLHDWLGLKRGGKELTQESEKDKLNSLKLLFNGLNERLTLSPFLAGNKMTYVDIHLSILVECLNSLFDGVAKDHKGIMRVYNYSSQYLQ